MTRPGLLALAIALAASSAAAQAYKPPRTPFGQPDLQGVWNNETLTRLQRPATYTTLVLPPADAAARERKAGAAYAREVAPLSPDAPAPADGAVEQDAEQWFGPPLGFTRIRGEARTSLIVDPADGRLPYTDAAREAMKAVTHLEDEVFDNPEGRPFDERCVLGAGNGAGPPFLYVGAANTLLQILQTRDHVLLLAEANHDYRIVRLGTRRHAPAAVTPWMGDSVGWWEGDVLVVETTNFNPGEHWRWARAYMPITTGARIVERFERLGPKEIGYSFTVSDPKSYTQTWRAEATLNASSGRIFEYACHEGNYAMRNILGGARAQERAASPAVQEAAK